MVAPNLTDADRTELARLLRQSIDAGPLPALAPRATVEGLLAKLDPEQPDDAEPYSSAQAWVNSSIGQPKRRR